MGLNLEVRIMGCQRHKRISSGIKGFQLRLRDFKCQKLFPAISRGSEVEQRDFR